ncbi:MAG: AfsR/SARP family transcriptional regulator, partial [Chloroflexota bacterium]
MQPNEDNPAQQLSINLFGPPTLAAGGQQVEISRRKAVALLCYLAVTGQKHSRDALAALFWPEASQRRARASLRSALWSLNKTPLEEWLRVEAETVSLHPNAPLDLDVAHFEALLAVPRQHDHSASEICADCLEPVAQAVSLYQDDFMAGFTLPDAPAFDEWQFFQASKLRELLASALKRLLHFYGAEEAFDRAIAYARRLVALDPLHEPAHVTLMQLYARAGQQAAALRQYQVYQDTLDAELGVAPSSEVTALYEQIKSGAWPERKAQQPQIVEPGPAPEISHNLPPDPTPFIGREVELEDVATFLDDPATRLVTILGPGGIGKTRLALAAARVALSKSRFGNGVYFVSLTPVTEPEAMLSLIAETVGYPLQSDRRSSAQQLFDYFRQKSLLLVLDNFEHLLAGANFLADLLQQAPQVTVLATSRERLNLREEQQYLLSGLAVPPDEAALESSEYAAAVLFLQCARRRRPEFKVSSADLPYLAEICRLVEGMPLAIEMAAVWTELLSLPEIAAELQQNLDFLETDVRNIPQRHRSMRAVFDASWQRLSENEQQTYAQLSVFRGGFTAGAAKAVTGASLKTLARLVNQSLLRSNPHDGRYDMHELLRQYTVRKLQETASGEAAVRQRHAAYYCTFLGEREDALKGAQQQEALAEIEVDSENVIAAWCWAAEERQIPQLAQALVPLALFYRWNGRIREGEAMCRLAAEALLRSEVAETDEEGARLLVKLLTWQSVFNRASAEYEGAEQALQQAQAFLKSRALRNSDTVADEAHLLLQLSGVASIQALGGDALALNEQSLSLYRSIDDAWGVAEALDALAAKHQMLGNADLAVELQEECLTIRQQLDDPRGIAKSYSSLGHYILFAGDIERSERHLRKSLDLFRQLDTRADLRHPLLILGINLLFGGKFQESVDSFEDCWAIHRELGMPHEPGSANVGIARAKINLGSYNEARDLSESDLARYRSLNHKWYIAFTLFNLGRIA